jgi:excisionase family DNA binding protein
MEQKCLTIAQAAKVYNIPSSTLYKLSARREIPLLKIGLKKVLIPVEEFEAWLRSHRVDSGQRKGGDDL